MNRRAALRSFLGLPAILPIAQALPLAIGDIGATGTIAMPKLPEPQHVLGERPFDVEGVLESLAAHVGERLEELIGSDQIIRLGNGPMLPGDSVNLLLTEDAFAGLWRKPRVQPKKLFVSLMQHWEATLVVRDFRKLANEDLRWMLLSPACYALADSVDQRRKGRPVVMAPLPTCLPGTGAISFCHRGRVPVRIVLSYSSATLMNCLTADVLFEPI